jgi:hypothetical protein
VPSTRRRLPPTDADQPHRDEHTVTATTNVMMNVCIFDEGFVGKIDDGQQTCRYCQTVRARLARREGVREKPVFDTP